MLPPPSAPWLKFEKKMKKESWCRSYKSSFFFPNKEFFVLKCYKARLFYYQRFFSFFKFNSENQKMKRKKFYRIGYWCWIFFYRHESIFYKNLSLKKTKLFVKWFAVWTKGRLLGIRLGLGFQRCTLIV